MKQRRILEFGSEPMTSVVASVSFMGHRKSLGLVRIVISAGSYVPEFKWAQAVNLPFASAFTLVEKVQHVYLPQSTDLSEEKCPSQRFGLQRPATKVFSCIAAASLILALILYLLSFHRASNFARFWQPVLDAASSPVLSLPTTDSFQLNLNSLRTLTSLNRLNASETLKVGANDVIGFHDWHVSQPVLRATLNVSSALQRKGKVPLVRFGTDVREDELRGHPIIAIGSFSNPWAKQNVTGLRFTFDRGVSDREPPHITDKFNSGRSWALIHTYPGPQSKDYAIITRTFDPVNHEPFVSLAGLHSFGNEIASEFVSLDSSWNEVARRAPLGWQKMTCRS
jgi:hypothetical protein